MAKPNIKHPHKVKRAQKTAQQFEDLYKEMLVYLTDKKNRKKFDYKRYMYERGFTNYRSQLDMHLGHPDLRRLWEDIEHVVIDTMSRGIISGELSNPAFVIRQMKLMFKPTNPANYYTAEEMADLEARRAAKELEKAQTESIKIGFGNKDD